ncbi:hypothetical protein HZS_4893 [Henneguya salminicola]|nr:hypothetical protein HZS_4893 [Henneguya salminicola]
MGFDPGSYEDLPTEDPRIHMIAGALSGIMEHTTFYPVDVIKTRLQCPLSNCKYGYKIGAFNTLINMIRTEGLGSLYRGVTSIMIGAGPAHAAYYSIYELSKKTASKFFNVRSDSSSAIHGLSGVAATLSHDIIMNPMEVIKQRLQVSPHRYSGLSQCFKNILFQEGPRALYRSLPAQLMMNLPFHCLNFIVYEYTRKKLIGNDKYNLLVHITAGAMSGGVASAATTPFDVVKTTLNVQDPNMIKIAFPCTSTSECVLQSKNLKIKGVWAAATTIYQHGGFRAFFNGLTPRIIFNIPSCAISWVVYESFKHFLNTD